jgi:uncharacterized cupin superfamily protein
VNGAVTHWDDVERFHAEVGHIGGWWRDLGGAAGSRAVGLKRIEVDPGKWSTPAHVHGAEEEIFYVLGGSGLSWQDGEVYEVRSGDCLVHRAGREVHTLRAGDDGLDVLAFGPRVRVELGALPRAGVGWVGRRWVDLGEPERTPWAREAAVGEPEVGEPKERPARVVNEADVEGEHGGMYKSLGGTAGAEQSGLNLLRLPPGEEGAPAHCHSVEEEIFVVLGGDGTLELWPSPARAAEGGEREDHGLRPGHVVSRPAGTGIAHLLRAGEQGLTYLAYGTRDRADVCYYPRSNKIYWRGVGLIARLEPLDYFDGEPA